MNRFLGLTIFLSLVLFSCSKSTEDKLIGSWFDEDRGVTITMNSDKTSVLSRNGETRPGVWSFNEENMQLCAGENHSNTDCGYIVNVDKNVLCIEERGDTLCLNKVK